MIPNFPLSHYNLKLPLSIFVYLSGSLDGLDSQWNLATSTQTVA